MWFFYDNIAPAAVAALCSLLAWLYGGTIASALVPSVPWMLVLTAELALCFPQRHQGETTYEARERAWKSLRRDKLLWMSLLFLAILAVPFFNTALCPCCDYPAIHFDGARQAPPLPWAPYCVDRMEHFNVYLWFLSAIVALLVSRHCLLKRGKRTALAMVVCNGLALSAIGMLQYVTGAESPLWAEGWEKTAYFFSTFGYPNMGGDYFTTLFCISVALWRRRLDEAESDERSDDPGSSGKTVHGRFWSRHLMLVPAAIFFFSAMMTLSRAAILLCGALAVLFFVHAFVSFVSRMHHAARAKTIVVSISVLSVIGAFLFAFATGRDKMLAKSSGNDIRDEIATIDGRGIIDRIAGKGQYHSRVALEVWKDNPAFGCGGWGYKHFCIPKMTDSEFAQLQTVGGINVHNDFLQFMAEHGAVGLLFLAAAIVILLAPVAKAWRVLARAAMFVKTKRPVPRPRAIFALPAGAFALLCAPLATFIHSFADCPLRSPAVLTLFFTCLACVDGFLPQIEEKKNRFASQRKKGK